MGHYKPNLRDLEFTLFTVLADPDGYGRGTFADTDETTARGILTEVARLASTVLADAHTAADRTPPVHDPDAHTVTVPAEFAAAYHTWLDAGWHLLDVPPALGGAVVPPSLRWAVAELVLGANPALYLYQSFGGFARILHEVGTPEQQDLARALVERRWGATMVLTEAEAGSDVGAARTRAVRQDDGTWHIEGVKRFITSGEHDLAENIVHFVLARPEGNGPGTKGLSLFLVPKYRVVDWRTGELGERNGVLATALEDKMGLKASATCELVFGTDRPAVGHLVGEVHDGIRQMFRVIETARMIVAVKSAATLSTGYLNAVAYARERVQGADLAALGDKSAPRVPVLRHPDVRRALLLQKAYAEGLRALVLYTATVQDRIAEAEAAGTPGTDARARNDLLLPIVKGYCSERAYARLGDALEVLGGSGYLRDFPLEQYVRDTRIDALYEGTTGIQGLDLFFRKIARDQGAALTALLDDVEKTARGATRSAGGPDADHALLLDAVADVRAMATAMGGDLLRSFEDPAAVYQVGRNTTRLLYACGDVLVGWLLLRKAAAAAEALDRAPADRPTTQPDDDYLRGVIASASYFVQETLPHLAVERARTERPDPVLMSVPDAAW
ncbi:acyl-CoA dehydrogenase [Streptomyces sp. NPDC059578]|uniref:acyl-CoA dehydrogenase n=2 Tax=unclassified Streptomyces TaxID=2593676 RepID=UPI0036A21D75